MTLKELIARYESRDTTNLESARKSLPTLSEIMQAIPKEITGEEFARLVWKVDDNYKGNHNLLNIVYLVAAVEFYDNPAEAFRILSENLPLSGKWMERFNFERFYHNEKLASESRAKYGIPHESDRITQNLNFTGPMAPSGKMNGRMPMLDGYGTSPSWDNIIRSMEG